ncbi:MAG: hypothetical protein AAFV33_15615 [Chloroflexota bacterium]
MTTLKPQTALGGFALLTVLLAGTAIGRVLGFGFDEALYLATLFLILIAWAFNRCLLRQTIEQAGDDTEDGL